MRCGPEEESGQHMRGYSVENRTVRIILRSVQQLRIGDETKNRKQDDFQQDCLDSIFFEILTDMNGVRIPVLIDAGAAATMVLPELAQKAKCEIKSCKSWVRGERIVTSLVKTYPMPDLCIAFLIEFSAVKFEHVAFVTKNE